jgi:hypothetical protein
VANVEHVKALERDDTGSGRARRIMLAAVLIQRQRDSNLSRAVDG